MSNFTPGPWSVGATDPDTAEIEIVSEGRPYVCLALPGAVDGRTEANARLIAAAPDLREALQGLLDDVIGLMRESEGVAGLHLNGDVADWASLDEGGRFERLSNMSAARAAIAKATGGAA